MEKFTREYRITCRDIDSDFYAKNTALFYYFEECFANFCFKNNIIGKNLDEFGLMWVIGSVNLEIIGELPCWCKILKIEAWFSKIKKLKAIFEFRIYFEDKEIARGDSCWFILDKKQNVL